MSGQEGVGDFAPEEPVGGLGSTEADSQAAASYVVVSFRLIRGREERFRFSLAELLGLVAWFAAHCSAWRLSYLGMLQEYSRLPKVAPQNCFVCSAVAKGHPCVVHAEEYLAPDGTAHRVNDQLRVLKAFELLLASVSPKCHRACRWLYDRLGPRLAELLVHPLSADVGYFVLKPVEWLATVCLRVAIPGQTGLVRGRPTTNFRFCPWPPSPPTPLPQTGEGSCGRTAAPEPQRSLARLYLLACAVTKLSGTSSSTRKPTL